MQVMLPKRNRIINQTKMAIKKQRKQFLQDSVDQLLKYFLKKMSYPDDGTRDNKTTSKY